MIAALFAICWWLAVIVDLIVIARMGLEFARDGGLLVSGTVMPPAISSAIFAFFTIHLLGLLASQVPS
jgi:hypothetical protein